MSNINETIAEVLRLDAQATQGPWDEDGIYMGLRHLGKHCSDWYYRDSDGNLIEVPQEKDAALVAYYRTAAPALAREVQRLKAEVAARNQRLGKTEILALWLQAGEDAARRAGQEAMRERCASRAARDADGACSCGRPICQPDCARVRLLDLADAIRALEVEP